MMAAWMLYALLVSVLLAAGVWALEEVCRLTDRASRFVWLGALLATLGLVAVAPLRSSAAALDSAGTALDIAALLPATAAGAGAPGNSSAAGELLGGVRAVMEWPLRAAAGLGEGGAGRWLVAGWLTLSLALLTLGAATLLRYHTARRRWPLRQVGEVGVRVAPAAGPAVVGLLRPEIVVPEWLLRAPPEEQRLVLLHEREHLRTRDPLVLAAGCLAAMLLPWNPVAWWMLLRLRLAVELDCDRRVLRSGVRPEAYGLLLIDMAGRGSGLPPGVAALAATPSTLERRILAMTRRLPRFATMRAAALGVLGSAALLAACDTRLPTSSEVENMDVAAVEAQAQRLHFLTAHDGNAIYFVDGSEVSAEEARALAADRIGRVEVRRFNSGQPTEIRIATRSGDADGRTTYLMRDVPPGEGEQQVRVLVRQRGEGGEARALASTDDFEGLLIIDGVVAPTSAMRTLQPDRIERVEILKGDAASQQYDDPRAAHGVIRITTKGAAGSH